MKLIRDLAYVRVGYTYRASLRNADAGNTAIIQTRDATPEAMAQPQFLARADLSHIGKTHFLIEGDLIFRARGLHNNFAHVIPPPQGLMICIAPLLRIRVYMRDKLLPEYLSWYINLPEIQEDIQRHAKISANTIFMIGAQLLESMPIVLPGLTQQQEIVDDNQRFKRYQTMEKENARKLLHDMEQTHLNYARAHDCEVNR